MNRASTLNRCILFVEVGTIAWDYLIFLRINNPLRGETESKLNECRVASIER